ncbi:MAG TPA: hypothetical protein VMV77_10955 [Bacteroidales bacterium]|nr:hypothetical protein [Bacteroidales bacterium]
MKRLYYLLSGLIIVAIPIMKFPQKEINNGLIRARIYLPDSKKGYYQGTRFDWSGNIESLEYKGHNYFGQWFKKYSPEIHDVIMGPVEEFMPLDYIETKAGDSFLKIGVGVLSKPDDKPYTFSRLYPVLNRGTWKVNTQSDQVQFIHELNDTDYSYLYEKRVQLMKDKPELVLSHTLKNTGSRTIETSVYDHNFFVIDKQPIGPGFIVKLPFDLKGEGEGIGELADIAGDKIVFLRELNDGETVFCSGLEGFGTTSKDYDIRIENKTTGAGVRITCDQPILKLNFWCCSTTVCPEPYIKIKVDPGEESHWEIRYLFYILP